MPAARVARLLEGGAERLRGRLDRRDGLRRGVIEPVGGLDRDPQAAQLDVAGIAERDRGDAAVVPVGPGDDAQEQRDVLHGAGDRPHLRARIAERAELPSSSSTPVSGTRPALGLSEASPQKWAGRRALAPESVPRPHGEPCAAMIAASPPLLPPGVRARS